MLVGPFEFGRNAHRHAQRRQQEQDKKSQHLPALSRCHSRAALTRTPMSHALSAISESNSIVGKCMSALNVGANVRARSWPSILALGK